MTKGRRKAKERRRIRHRGDNGLPKPIGRLSRLRYGQGPKEKNHASDDEADEP